MKYSNKPVIELYNRLLNNMAKVIVGKEEALKLSIIALICQGHILIEDVPGVGKTVLAKSLAKSLGCEFKRIQFTPDMLPGDITGISIYNQKNKSFEYKPGPIMTQILLADEINRATPKTQSALLEAMEERQITVDGETYKLPSPFIVMATQNPIEYEGTFPLPEAQLDRFLIKIRLGYPSTEDEVKILSNQKYQHPLVTLTKTIELNELREVQGMVKEVYISEKVKKYIVDLVRSTREHTDVYLGSSPRGSLGLMHTSQVLAIINDRKFVLPDDVKELASPVLAHRIVINPGGRVKNITAGMVIKEILSRLPVPGGSDLDSME
jgi:MoxR-like ATPase